jgi:hypothetical protein
MAAGHGAEIAQRLTGSASCVGGFCGRMEFKEGRYAEWNLNRRDMSNRQKNNTQSDLQKQTPQPTVEERVEGTADRRRAGEGWRMDVCART